MDPTRKTALVAGTLLPDHLRHLDPRPVPSRSRAEQPRLHRRRRRRHPRAARLPPRRGQRPRRHRHRRRALPGGQAAARRLRARLRHHPPARSRRHHDRRRQPPGRRDPATEPRRNRRSRPGLARHRRPVARRRPRLDLPARPQPHGGAERPAARHPDVPVPARATPHPHDGLIGAVLLLADVTAIFFGSCELGSAWHGIAAAPIFVWELSLGIYLVVKGFKPSPITTTVPRTDAAARRRRRPEVAHREPVGRFGRAHRTPFTGRMAAAPRMAQTPATA